MLSNLTVIELASVLAGPSVGQFFAELGAEVIKIENTNTNGDVTRSWKGAIEQTDDRSAYFCSVNWGKKSVALDLHTEAGRIAVHTLIKKADVVIASYKPGDAEKLKVDYATLSQINPGLIYGQITGYGSDNARVGYDAVVQAESGFMFMNGEPSGASLKMPVALIDVLAGHHLKEGLLLAMLEKTKSGKGKLVEVSLIQSAISSLVNQASNWLISGALPQKQGSLHPNIAPYGEVFKTKDDKEILLAIGSDKQFDALCEILGLMEVAEHDGFNTNQKRVKNRAQLDEILTTRFKNFNLNDILPIIHQAKIPAGVIQNMKQVFEMPEARELLITANGLRGIRTFAVTNINMSPLLPPPHYGEHTEEILKRL